MSTLGVWTCVELMVAVASASMPIMRPLFQVVFPKSWRFSTAANAIPCNCSRPLFRTGKNREDQRTGEGFERLQNPSENGSHSYALRTVEEARGRSVVYEDLEDDGSQPRR